MSLGLGWDIAGFGWLFLLVFTVAGDLVAKGSQGFDTCCARRGLTGLAKASPKQTRHVEKMRIVIGRITLGFPLTIDFYSVHRMRNVSLVRFHVGRHGV